MKRQHFHDGTEVIGGYARAIRAGNHIHVSGTTSANAKGEVVGDDVYEQTIETYRKIEEALEKLGAGLRDVVRITAYITDITQAEGYSRAHERVFAGIDPAAALIGTSALMKPEMLIEIEAYAIVAET